VDECKPLLVNRRPWDPAAFTDGVDAAEVGDSGAYTSEAVAYTRPLISST